MNKLPENCHKCSIPSFKRYEKKVPGNHVRSILSFFF